MIDHACVHFDAGCILSSVCCVAMIPTSLIEMGNGKPYRQIFHHACCSCQSWDEQPVPSQEQQVGQPWQQERGQLGPHCHRRREAQTNSWRKQTFAIGYWIEQEVRLTKNFPSLCGNRSSNKHKNKPPARDQCSSDHPQLIAWRNSPIPFDQLLPWSNPS
jgi:hypothetical protein